jgi:hypothetical protein
LKEQINQLFEFVQSDANEIMLSLEKVDVSIISMSLLPYVLNLSGTFIGVSVSFPEFTEGLWTYLLAGSLMFICILPIMLVSIVVKKSFLLSICVSIVYSLASFLASWVAPLAALLPIDVAWRIMDLKQFEMRYSFPMSVSYASLAIFTVVSVAGILYVSQKQEA